MLEIIGMWVADNWKDYEVIDTANGEKLERWGDYILVRPDPQVIWSSDKSDYRWKKMNGHYHRSKAGGGEWEFFAENGEIHTRTNHSGGIQGGISNGAEIYFRVLFKPVPTILKEQNTVNSKGENVVMKAKGRHDPCVLQRALPVVESMAAMTILDYYLLSKTNKL